MMLNKSISYTYYAVLVSLTLLFHACKQDSSIQTANIIASYRIDSFEHRVAVNNFVDDEVTPTHSYIKKCFNGTQYDYENYSFRIGFQGDTSIKHVEFSGNSFGNLVFEANGQYYLQMNCEVEQYRYFSKDPNQRIQHIKSPIAHYNDENRGIWKFSTIGEHAGIQLIGGSYEGSYLVHLDDKTLRISKTSLSTFGGNKSREETTTSTFFNLTAE